MAPIKQSKLKLKESIIEFYKLHSKKGHGYTYNQWKRCDLSERTICRVMEKFEFYKLHSKKGHGYTYNQWKCCDLSERTVYRLLEKFDKEGTIARKSQRKMDYQVSLNSKYLYVTYF